MSVLIGFAPASLTAQQHVVVKPVRRKNTCSPEASDTLGSDGKLLISEIWDSREQLEAFSQRLLPVLAQVGIKPGEPEVIEIHSIVER